MCWELFLGSDKELPHVEWDEASPEFNTQQLSDSEGRVKVQFSAPYVIYIGSHQGCSCGFFSSEGDEPEDENKRAKDNRLLSQYLDEALRDGAKVELFLCWQGGELNAIAQRKVLAPGDFLNEEFPLGEDELASVISA